jgi:hypothetical protein
MDETPALPAGMKVDICMCVCVCVCVCIHTESGRETETETETETGSMKRETARAHILTRMYCMSWECWVILL